MIRSLLTNQEYYTIKVSSVLLTDLLSLYAVLQPLILSLSAWSNLFLQPPQNYYISATKQESKRYMEFKLWYVCITNSILWPQRITLFSKIPQAHLKSINFG